MPGKRIVVVGSNVAGFAAALALKDELGARAEVTVLSKTEQFWRVLGLVWVPFGQRAREELTFRVRPLLEERKIRFRCEEVTRLDLKGHRVITARGDERYDWLVLATGGKPNWGAVPGLGPRGYTQSIVSWSDAELARGAFEKFLLAPGPVVIGGIQRAGWLGSAQDFLFAMAHQLEQRGLEEKAPLTFLAAEPRLHLEGLSQVKVLTGAVQKVAPSEIQLSDGRKLPFAYAMLAPPLLGVDAVRACDSLTNASGFVPTNAFGQNVRHPEVFAVGVAAAEPTLAPQQMGKEVAHNLASLVRGQPMVELGSVPA